MSKLNQFLLFLFAILCIFIWVHRPESVVAPRLNPPVKRTSPAPQPIAKLPPPPPAAPVLEVDNPKPNETSGRKKLTLPFVMNDGIAVVQGDVAIGKPMAENPPETGIAIVPLPQKWKTRVIPYYIQPNVVDPDRVKIAISMFDQTAVRFVPHTDQADGIVFEDGTGICKSYVGRIGGLQPIWIPASCGPAEIAHEILHALGFVHEQNRTDRDDFINVLFDNIDERYKDNFEKLPPEFMFVSGLAPFDFESLMIYPVWMFAKGGQVTMETKSREDRIQPGNTLSPSDIDRINRAYGQLTN